MATFSSPVRQDQITLPSHIVDLAADELRSTTGEQVELRPRSLAVLRILAENAGRIVHKNELMTEVWRDVVVTDDSLTQCIADIRKAIGDKEHRILRTVPRRGYVLVPSKRDAASSRQDSSPVIAVMPFTCPVGAKGEALAIGIASEVINELARNRELRLIGRDSSFALGRWAATAQELGERLGARYLVEGTAQRLKNMLVVDVQLVDARNAIIAWGDRFSAKAADIPRVQRLIANRIAASVRVSVRETERQAVLGRAPQDLGVYELTLCKHEFTGEATRAARESLEEAIRRDPNYAPAWSRLAWINLTDIWTQLTHEWGLSRIDEVVDQFRRAIELDPNLAKAYEGLGQAMRTKGDLSQAVTLSHRALALGPSDPDNLIFHALTVFELGDLSEATEMVEQALALHPLRPSYYSYFHAMILWGNKRFQEALDEADECIRRAPQLWGAHVYKALALVGLGRMAEAKTQLEEYLALAAGPPVPPHSPELARRFLADLKSAGWKPSVAIERVAV
jgi:TolB-like protein/tetratricopeptide (TPR) repeat protein